MTNRKLGAPTGMSVMLAINLDRTVLDLCLPLAIDIACGCWRLHLGKSKAARAGAPNWKARAL